MLNDFYNELIECVSPLEITEVYYSHVEKNIDENKTYITYYRTSKTTDYEIGVDSSVIQISIFSKSLELAINTRDSISKYFVGMNKVIGTTQICGSSIESEIESYDYESKMHHAITTIRFLTKNSDEFFGYGKYDEILLEAKKYTDDKIANLEIPKIDLSNIENDINNLQSNLVNVETEIDTKINEVENNILNIIYPVGSIYISMNNSPPTFGTWQQIANGKTLIGVDENDIDFNEVGKTGGAKTHTLSINEMPAHTHYYQDNTVTNTTPSGIGSARAFSNATMYSKSTNYVGSNKPHNNLQPYITTYIFQRIK